MAFLESTLAFFTLALMLVVLFFSLIPFVPGPALLWVISLVFGIFDNFTRLTPLTFFLITTLTLAGSTTDFWMPLLGMRSRGASCGSVLGTITGALLGTVFIPLPVVGTFIGAAGGAALMEFLAAANARRTLRTTGLALESYILSIGVEFVINLSIVGLFILSFMTTGGV